MGVLLSFLGTWGALSLALVSWGQDNATPSSSPISSPISSDISSDISSEGCLTEAQYKRDGIDFIMANMPAIDKGIISQERVAAEVELALKTRATYPWAKKVPWGIYRNDVLPYAVLDETRDEWRAELAQKIAPIVANCLTGSQAALAVAGNIEKTLKVSYSILRDKPNQSPKESMSTGRLSCTGQSILLVDALRSVGIPARIAGVLLWSHIMGNHTWVEAWCDGAWQMIECGEKDFNTPWVMENIGMLDIQKKKHHIMASSWSDTGNDNFPLIWYARQLTPDGDVLFDEQAPKIPGLDVTERYMRLAKNWYAKHPSPERTQKLYVDHREKGQDQLSRTPVEVVLKDTQGKEWGRGKTPGTSEDVRQFLNLTLPQDRDCYLEWQTPNGTKIQKKVTPTNTPVQIVCLNE